MPRRTSITMPRGPKQDKTIPHVTNLHADPMMSGIVYHSLTKGELTFGRSKSDPLPDVIIGNVGVQKNHAKIKLLSNGLFELVVAPEGAASTMVNGEAFNPKKCKRVLNHCDRIAICSSNIYVFKYPKLNRALKEVLAAAGDEVKSMQGITEKDMNELAWKKVQETGIEGVVANNVDSMKASDYSTDEQKADEATIDWDTAYTEVENAEAAKIEKQNKERQKTHQQEIERQKKAAMDQINANMAKFEQEKLESEKKQAEEKARIEAEKLEMEQQLEIMKGKQTEGQQQMLAQIEEMQIAAK